jgi:hypothetical protein
MTTPVRYPLPSGAASPLQPEVKPACNISTRLARQRESTPTGYRPLNQPAHDRPLPVRHPYDWPDATGPATPGGSQSVVEFRWGQARSAVRRAD